MYIAILLAAIFVWLWIKHSKVPPGMTFSDYSKAHPDCVKDGQIRCAHCGGKQVWMRRYASYPSKQVNSHVCKSCGQELYRSITML